MKSFLLFFILFSLKSFSSVVKSPSLDFDYEQNPSGVVWKHLLTEHFNIIFPQAVENQAQEVAHLLEKAYPIVSRSLEVRPPKIPIVLQTHSMISNGFVTLAPRRSELFLTPTINPELSNSDWLKTLALHEFRHVVQFHKTRQGFNRVYETLLGEIGQAVGLGLTLPPWFLEGDAVGIETAFTHGGRGRIPLFERNLRTFLLSGKQWSYDQAHLGSYQDFIPNHYVYGYFYTSWLRNKYGDLFLSTLADESAKKSWNPLTFYNATEKLTELEFEKLYETIISDLVREWRTRAQKIKPSPFVVRNLKKENDFINYLYPQLSSEGKILALKNGLSFIDHFVLMDGDQEEILFYPGVLQNEYPFKMRRNKLVFFEWELDPRWGLRDFSKLRVFDLNKKKFILTINKTRGRLAVPDHQGEKILYVEWTKDQDQSFIVLDEKGKLLKKIRHPSDEVITSLDWINDEEVVFVFKDQQDKKGIKKINLLTKEITTLFKRSYLNLGFISVSKGHILVESPENGIDNIWALTPEGLKQITSSSFGAYAPTLFQNKLLYNEFSAHGMNIAEKALPWNHEHSSEDVFFPIYKKFSLYEDKKTFEKELNSPQIYEVKEYSQVKNSLNLHSWLLLAPPLSPNVTLVGFSRDILNNFTLSFGGNFNTNEETLGSFIQGAWTHYYPVFDLGASFGTRRQDYLVSGSEVQDTWEEGTLEGGVSLPWRFIQDRFIHRFTFRAFSSLIQVSGKTALRRSEINRGVFHSPGVEASYEILSRLSPRDIRSPLGISLNARFEEGSDLTGSGEKGALTSLRSELNLPGLVNHHSFYHELSYEKQLDQSYQYASLVLYPRGTKSVFLEEFSKYSGNYLLPLFYPDLSLSRYLYLKRVYLNLFYDELSGRLASNSYQAASYGWETFFEMNIARIFIPLTFGVRGSYVISGREKSPLYELFLATQLGTF